MSSPASGEVLTRGSLRRRAEKLARDHEVLAKAVEVGGWPKLWRRPLTFATFIRVILEQQVSLASAWNTFDRLASRLGGGVTPDGVATIGQEGLRSLGFSRQKARYADVFADRCLSGEFKIASLRRLSDATVRERITAELGMGDWTADVILMLALRRTDPFPTGDLALMKGLRMLTNRPELTPDEAIAVAEPWRPYRAVASRMIWAAYLNGKPIPGQN